MRRRTRGDGFEVVEGQRPVAEATAGVQEPPRERRGLASVFGGEAWQRSASRPDGDRGVMQEMEKVGGVRVARVNAQPDAGAGEGRLTLCGERGLAGSRRTVNPHHRAIARGRQMAPAARCVVRVPLYRG
ncbi:MAG: hypothetical protein U5K73_11845 [Halofilum sp. (in: g-proteobacteria)]|nr:hypothetical protein [Halofilum sp. (in: g-proteobacteria)]